jgi:hypothetical protein
MTTLRTKVGYSKWLGDFMSHIYVGCPKCSKQALVTRPPEQKFHYFTNTKVTCQHCGFNQTAKGNVISDLNLTYWLQMECEGQTLWAYNYEHLTFLKQLIGANLRERNGVPNANSSLGSRLPRWMTSSKKRSKVLKCLERLQQK